jgi:DinB superfamily
MKPIFTVLLTATLLSVPAAFGADPTTVAKVYDGQLAGIEGEFVPLVEAMPADKFNFKPTGPTFATVRTFGEQCKHVGAVLYLISATALGEKPPIDLGAGENGPDSVKTKEQVVKFVKDAFAYAHKATLAMTAKNEVEMVKSPFGPGDMSRGSLGGLLTWHSFDHYGQIVVYARMNGVVPPASR